MGAIRLCVWSLLLFLVAGCGGGGSSSSNSAAPRLNEAHEPGWRSIHDEAYARDPVRCQVCHGENFRGNGAVVSCFSCHIGGPPFQIHPPNLEASLEWRFPINQGIWASRDIKGCQGCHGEPGGPGSNPRINLPMGRLDQGCESTEGCHFNGGFEWGHNFGAAHPAYDPNADPNDPRKQDRMHWYGGKLTYRADGIEKTRLLGHYDAGNLTGACTLCHGADLRGGVGPSCLNCHVSDPIANPSGCISCHGRPVASPQAYASQVGRLTPLDPVFLSEVSRRNEIVVDDPVSGTKAIRLGHLQHDSIPLEQRDTQEDCRVCHVEPAAPVPPDPNDPNFDQLQEEFKRAEAAFEVNPNRISNRHHLFLGRIIPPGSVAPFPSFNSPGDSYSCKSCHITNIDPNTGTITTDVPRDCAECHTALFAE